MDVETDAGVRSCEVAGALVEVSMGRVRVLGERSLEVEGLLLLPWLADAGNPHAVLFGEHAAGDPERLGPRIATHSAFPQGTNVGFAAVREGRVDLVVWERGVGLTLACGTGACAAVAVACERGLLPGGASVDVRLPGGTLTVTRDAASGETRLRGPARHVFAGQLP